MKLTAKLIEEDSKEQFEEQIKEFSESGYTIASNLIVTPDIGEGKTYTILMIVNSE